MGKFDRINGIQVMRCVAALSVVLYHSSHRTHSVFPTWKCLWIEVGSIGVDLFFVISGFLMVHILRPGLTPFEFIKRRFLRVAPLYWVAIILGAILPLYIALGPKILAPAKFWHVILDMMFVFHPARQVLGVGWTLNYEAFFYAVFGLCLFFGRRHLLAVTVIILAVSFALYLAPIPQWLTSRFANQFMLVEFLFGMGLALLSLKNCDPKIGVSLIATGVVLACMTKWLPAFPRGLSQGLPAALIIGGTLIAEPYFSSRKWNPFLYLGDASYSIYLAHMFALSALSGPMKQLISLTGMPGVTVLLSFFVCGVAIGLAAYHLIEKPLNAFFRARSRSLDRPRYEIRGGMSPVS